MRQFIKRAALPVLWISLGGLYSLVWLIHWTSEICAFLVGRRALITQKGVLAAAKATMKPISKNEQVRGTCFSVVVAKIKLDTGKTANPELVRLALHWLCRNRELASAPTQDPCQDCCGGADNGYKIYYLPTPAPSPAYDGNHGQAFLFTSVAKALFDTLIDLFGKHQRYTILYRYLCKGYALVGQLLFILV